SAGGDAEAGARPWTKSLANRAGRAQWCQHRQAGAIGHTVAGTTYDNAIAAGRQRVHVGKQQSVVSRAGQVDAGFAPLISQSTASAGGDAEAGAGARTDGL